MSVQSIRSAQEPGRIGAAFLVALALHAVGLLALAYWQSQDDISPGEQEITIDLAPAMLNVESVAPAEVSAPDVPPTEVEATPLEPLEETAAVEEEVEAVEPQMIEALSIEASPVENVVTEDAVVIPPQETVTAQTVPEKPAPKPVKPPPPKPVERKPNPTPRREPREQQPPAADARQGQASASRENLGGAAASGDPNLMSRYRAAVGAAVRRRLRFPSGAGSLGTSGIAKVRFSIDPSGTIISVTLIQSAGHPALDAAALAATRAGSSVPPIPAGLPSRLPPFEIPLNFNFTR
ncbi:energy transducer TonB [Microvirga sp. 2YAF29]|uniref:energy transducer TonB family protein n=1 Tax=Microvirga sp. 2YAF29 TaxID=3233031 RepID=UPI003F957500